MKYLKKINHIGMVIQFYVACISMVCLTGVTLLQVFFRYVLNKPLTWPEEIAILFLVYLVFTGTGYLYKVKGHIAAKYLLNHLKMKYFLILSVLIHICIFSFAIFLIRFATGVS